MEGKEELFRFLQSSGRVFCIFRLRDFLSFQAVPEKPPFRLISQNNVGSNSIVLISNQ